MNFFDRLFGKKNSAESAKAAAALGIRHDRERCELRLSGLETRTAPPREPGGAAHAAVLERFGFTTSTRTPLTTGGSPRGFLVFASRRPVRRTRRRRDLARRR